MKKLVTALLLLTYFTATTGVVVSLHYCMDRFDSVRVGTDASDECGNCGMHKGLNECCWDDVSMVKLQTAHMATASQLADFSFLAEPPVHQEIFLPPGKVASPDIPTRAHGPPLTEKDICVMHCVFRI